MRDKIFETSESLTVTDSSSLTQARQEGSSVSIGFGTTILILLFIIGIGIAGTKVIKSKDGKGITGGKSDSSVK